MHEYSEYLNLKEWKKEEPTSNGYKKTCVKQLDNGFLVINMVCTEVPEGDMKEDTYNKTTYKDGKRYTVKANAYYSEKNPLDDNEEDLLSALKNKLNSSSY